MKKIIITIILCSQSILLFNQNTFFGNGFPADKIKTGYKSEVDNEYYEVGDEIILGSPLSNDNYNHVYLVGYKYDNFDIDNYKYKDAYKDIFGKNKKYQKEPYTRFKYAHREIEEKKFKVKKILKSKKGSHFLVGDYSYVDIVVNLDRALVDREIYSKNNEFNENFVEILQKKNSDKESIISFDSKYMVELTKVYGDKSAQKVFIDFTLTHAMSNQKIRFSSQNYNNFTATDFGNNLYKNLKIAPKGDKLISGAYTGMIMTGQAAKYTIEIPDVLPEVELMKLVRVYCNSYNENSYNENGSGYLIFENLKIDWNYLDSIRRIEENLKIEEEKKLEVSYNDVLNGIEKDDLVFTLKEVKAEKNDQKVTFVWLVENKGINVDNFKTIIANIIDDNGNEVILNKSYYGSTQAYPSFFTITKELKRMVPLKLEYTFMGIPPNSTKIVYFEFPFEYHKVGRPYSEKIKDKFILRDIPLTWK